MRQSELFDPQPEMAETAHSTPVSVSQGVPGVSVLIGTLGGVTALPALLWGKPVVRRRESRT